MEREISAKGVWILRGTGDSGAGLFAKYFDAVTSSRLAGRLDQLDHRDRQCLGHYGGPVRHHALRRLRRRPWRHQRQSALFADHPCQLTNAQLTFRHSYDLESGYDGGVLEISINGGAFTDILSSGGSFVTNGYNQTISAYYQNPLAGRNAWSGNSGGFVTTSVRLPAAAGGTVQLRWRLGSDNSAGAVGWYVDSICAHRAQLLVLHLSGPAGNHESTSGGLEPNGLRLHHRLRTNLFS